MDDKDLFPCPWCRGGRVTTLDRYGGRSNPTYYVDCESCDMEGPAAATEDEARQVYNVVAQLVDDAFNAMAVSKNNRLPACETAIIAFMHHRREHPPY